MTRLAVIFGGANNEHEVSCRSARDVVAALDPGRYDIALLGIDRRGGWHRVDAVEELESITTAGVRLPDLAGIDLAMPIMHGRFGEDGTLQGMLELAGVPYTGCGVLASALAMDKSTTATVLAAAGVPTIDGVAIGAHNRILAAGLVARLGYPLFVKPNRSGSSVGVSRVEREAELDAAIGAALEHDDVALVQPAIEGGEVDVALIQQADGELIAGAPLRVHPAASAAFFDYEAKYTANGAEFEVPADLPPETTERVIRLARQAFRALGCDGIARVDFFLAADGTLTLNEVNTLPGLTAHSQLPRMFAATGRDLGWVLDTLVDRALPRQRARVA
ncbi:MAG TPA: D-alanine--D-alanine ligase family protein [Galbitalea sp.]|jgi:D-alanine-D-alanine ligase